ncbi:hypothetical protein EOD41_01205 [Mucilaginibacter limnophilus]|uniref:Uncharacterized protein n=1 Tax=Mucilaginibacter limnophilus TaxID=1932778 RepID=A0A3S2Y5L6_9SPHI|nr:hypothetical protein [Mucilaginibacter limnophilus]RVU02587.1 hypothetical protein EOD41_01205 [Mucilaginibacter limnophilus]
MKKLKYSVLSLLVFAMVACDKKNDNVIKPNVGSNFPQILNLADEGDGEIEDEDKFSFKIELIDRVDPDGEELEGRIVPLKQTVRVHFEVTDHEGFSNLADFIKDAKAFYEIDDCTTSEDENIDLHLEFDKATGKGSVDFPAGVEEIEIEFETDPDLFDDKVLNADDRKLEIKLTSVDAKDEKVVVNTANKFEFEVLDDESIYGKYELDIDDADQFTKFKNLFGLINEDVKGLSADDVEEIEVEFEYGEFKAVVVLKETEEVDECGETETVNKEIEIEGGIEELDIKALEGAVEFADDIEQEDGSEKEFKYSGEFKIVGDKLELTLKGEYDDEETDGITLVLNK